MSIEPEYRARLAARQAALTEKEHGHARFSYARLAIAGVAGALFLFLGWGAVPWLVYPIVAFGVTAFLHARLLNARDRAASAVAFYERGLARAAHQWIGKGDSGDRFREPEHPYADDLDIFGRGSLFELLATTRTRAGQETLAHWLLHAAPPAVIRERQEAVRDLMPRLDLRERLAVLGDGLGVGVDAAGMRPWAVRPRQLPGGNVRAALFALTAAVAAALVVVASTERGGRIALALLAVQAVIALRLKTRVQSVMHGVEAPARDLTLLADVLRTMEQQTFTAPRLVALQRELQSTSRPASAEVGRLAQLAALLASRDNVMFALIAALLMWATHCALAIEAWRGRVGSHVPAWLDAVGELEALVALGTFAAEHPGYVFPDLVAAPAQLSGHAIAHPLLGDEAVANDAAISAAPGGAAPALLVVSGSNMSGKSTFLRALGVNVVLASAGAPVRAAAFRISPLAIGASIRILDSLQDGRSRFFAEIQRLKQVVDLATASHGQVLFLLDEILAGTNSHDRRHGAEALMRGLVGLGAIGLVTTHDLALGDIAANLAPRAANVHFQDHFADGHLHFDYRLRPGIVQTSNAIALMRSIGLDV